MDDREKARTTALPADDRPEVHQAGAGSARSGPISLEQDKEIREGHLPGHRFDDQRMKDVPAQPAPTSNQDDRTDRERTERGIRGPDEQSGFGQGA